MLNMIFNIILKAPNGRVKATLKKLISDKQFWSFSYQKSIFDCLGEEAQKELFNHDTINKHWNEHWNEIDNALQIVAIPEYSGDETTRIINRIRGIEDIEPVTVPVRGQKRFKYDIDISDDMKILNELAIKTFDPKYGVVLSQNEFICIYKFSQRARSFHMHYNISSSATGTPGEDRLQYYQDQRYKDSQAIFFEDLNIVYTILDKHKKTNNMDLIYKIKDFLSNCLLNMLLHYAMGNNLYDNIIIGYKQMQRIFIEEYFFPDEPVDRANRSATNALDPLGVNRNALSPGQDRRRGRTRATDKPDKPPPGWRPRRGGQSSRKIKRSNKRTRKPMIRRRKNIKSLRSLRNIKSMSIKRR
jgi:hypothetical protein